MVGAKCETEIVKISTNYAKDGRLFQCSASWSGLLLERTYKI